MFIRDSRLRCLAVSGAFLNIYFMSSDFYVFSLISDISFMVPKFPISEQSRRYPFIERSSSVWSVFSTTFGLEPQLFLFLVFLFYDKDFKGLGWLAYFFAEFDFFDFVHFAFCSFLGTVFTCFVSIDTRLLVPTDFDFFSSLISYANDISSSRCCSFSLTCASIVVSLERQSVIWLSSSSSASVYSILVKLSWKLISYCWA